MALNDLERRLCDFIATRGSLLLDQLREAVAIPTGHNFTPGLEQYRAQLVQRLRSLGAEIDLVPGKPRPGWLEMNSEQAAEPQIIQPIVLAKRNKGAKKPRVLIAGHIDTVHDPHGAFQTLQISADQRTATGPGAVDMKGGICIGVAALEALQQCGVELNWTFLLNSDEETGSFHSHDCIFETAQRHDVGIALEPALPDGSLATQRMGSGQFKVEVFGRSAHVGRDFAKGISAVSKLAEIMIALAAMADPKRGIIVNVGPVQGGSATNIVPDYAACWGNMRFADPAMASLVQRQLDALATPADAMPRVAVHHVINRPAKPLTDSVKKLAEAAQMAAGDLNQSLPFASTGGVCDGNIMQAAGLPTLDTLGVRGGNLHRTDEFIEIASLVERCQLLAVLLARL